MSSKRRCVLYGLVVLCCYLAEFVSPLSASTRRQPSPVSPGREDGLAAVEARCPTFQWAGVPGASGYEIAVFRLDAEEGAEPALVVRAKVAGDARGWTPSSGECLERGERYGWSVAASALGRAPEWSAPLLFEVDRAPTTEEVDRAAETLRRYLDTKDPSAPARDRTPPAPPRARPALEPAALANATVGARSSAVGARIGSAVSAPASGPASLTVSNQVHLGEASAFFKEGELFLWDDDGGYSPGAFGNTALGRNALSSVDYNDKNTAIGRDALREAKRGATGEYTYPSEGSGNTAVGYKVLASGTSGFRNTGMGNYALQQNDDGFSNTGIGYGALRSNQGGDRNTAVGVYVLGYNTAGVQNTAAGTGAMFSNQDGVNNSALGFSSLQDNTSGDQNAALGANALKENESGSNNTALGTSALFSGTVGERNTAVGYKAGFSSTGHDNVLIQNNGSAVPGESHVLRIGQSTSNVNFYQFSLDKAFIHGIRGKTTGMADALAVVIDSAGQLGTVSSARRTKQDIQDLSPLDERLLALHPVSFRYRQHVASDPDTPLQFGLIAEEVAEVFPELVVFDSEGRPETVKYHLLNALLLAEVQRLHARLEAVEAASRSGPDSTVESSP